MVHYLILCQCLVSQPKFLISEGKGSCHVAFLINCHLFKIALNQHATHAQVLQSLTPKFALLLSCYEQPILISKTSE